MCPDDLSIYTTINNNEDKNKLQCELNELVNWANKWQLKINHDTTAALFKHETIIVLISHH